MTPIDKRFMYFLLGCIPFRLALVVLARILPIMYVKWLALPALGIALGFWIIFLFGLRKTGLETQGAPIWWNALRPIHGTLWAMIVYFAWTQNRDALWRTLMLDVVFALVGFAIWHGIHK
jgi:hypothetical protein